MIFAASFPRPFKITRSGFYEPCSLFQQYRLHLLRLRKTHVLRGMRNSLSLLPEAFFLSYHVQDLLSLVCNRSRDTECLKTFSDCSSSVSSSSAVFFDCDSSTYNVSPACIFKTDRLDSFYLIVNIQSSIFCDFFSFFDRSNSVACLIQH